ncbi:glycosyltransferase family 2 protein [Azospirillum brasilense]|uniref:glycosyltransferase family 2 protein n=1 Tax=Azospirillum brasilense TaxID=192 RepID=UPI000E0C985C|nr:glycosyltransferase family 2 protein [Azospirillum brasilense]
MIPVSVVVMTRNEAVNLPHCLSALDRFAERFVVDSGSTDGTPAIAAAAGARVVPFQWDGRYPKKKQWCLDQLPFGQDWVLFVDADERLGGALVEEIATLMATGPRHAGYFIDGRPVFLGRRLRYGAGNRKLALFDRRKARFPPAPDLDVATMWEVEGHYQPVIAGTVGRLRHSLDHADDKPVAAWFERHARYADWEAALRSDGRMRELIGLEIGARRWLKSGFNRLPARPLLAFLYGYVLRLGFLDGGPGLQHALARSFYYWQIGVKIADARRRAGLPASTND